MDVKYPQVNTTWRVGLDRMIRGAIQNVMPAKCNKVISSIMVVEKNISLEIYVAIKYMDDSTRVWTCSKDPGIAELTELAEQIEAFAAIQGLFEDKPDHMGNNQPDPARGQQSAGAMAQNPNYDNSLLSTRLPDALKRQYEQAIMQGQSMAQTQVVHPYPSAEADWRDRIESVKNSKASGSAPAKSDAQKLYDQRTKVSGTKAMEEMASCVSPQGPKKGDMVHDTGLMKVLLFDGEQWQEAPDAPMSSPPPKPGVRDDVKYGDEPSWLANPHLLTGTRIAKRLLGRK